MIDGKSILAIIPARGGSKRLPRKNIKELAGKPLIAWSIEAGLKSRYIDEVVVSTDDQEIFAISQSYGAKVPFLRPEELSNDTASSFSVVEHAVKFYSDKLHKPFDYVLLLQPTSPLRDHCNIDEALELLMEKGADSVISVCEMEHSPLWSNTLPSDLAMNGFLREDIKGKRSQDLETYYRINGAIYICQTQRMLVEKTLFFEDKIFAYIMPKEKSTDIDTELDFRICEVLMQSIE